MRDVAKSRDQLRIDLQNALVDAVPDYVAENVAMAVQEMIDGPTIEVPCMNSNCANKVVIFDVIGARYAAQCEECMKKWDTDGARKTPP